MQTFNLVISKILRVSLIFLLFFIWARFYFDNLLFSILISSVLCFIFDAALTFLSKKNDIKQNLQQEELKKAEGYANYFIFNPKKALSYFSELLAKNFTTIIKNDAIHFSTQTKKNLLVPLYLYEDINIQQIINIYNKHRDLKVDNIFIVCNKTNKSIEKFIKSLPIHVEIFDKYEVYEIFMKKNNFYPAECYKDLSEEKFSFKLFLQTALNKKRAKGYVFASFILLISSLFVKITLYYLIMSSILLLLAIFSYYNSIFNKKTQKNEFF